MAKQLTGIVVSDKTDKTIMVRVDRQKQHPLYRKQYTISKRFAVHDEKNEAHLGDKVLINEIVPKSKTKRFALNTILQKAPSSKGDSS